ncbi:MAG: hypothetical protein AB8D52_07560 [Gammaproteobacteria bacterium]
MKVTTKTIAAVMMAGMVSSQAFADDVNTVIDVNNNVVPAGITHNTNPKISIQDYIDQGRDVIAIEKEIAANNQPYWERDRIL